MEERRPTKRITHSADQPRMAEDKRLEPVMRALKAIHSAASPESMALEDLERQRAGQELLGRLVTPRRGVNWSPFDLDGMPAAWTTPSHWREKQKVILYCHGGGYTSGNLGYSRPLAAKLAEVTGYAVFCFEYRLAPEHPFPAAADDALKAWDHLMYLGYGARDAVVAGDSAGGNLALVLCHRLKAQERRLPARLVLMSPWTDMTASGKSYTQRAEIDPMLTLDYIQAVRSVYARDHDLTDPLLSPLLGDLSHFPPTLIQVGTNEILYSDSVRLRDRMVAAGVPCRLEVWKDMWHVFQMFPMHTADLAMESAGRFLLEDL
ncbi:MAG: alpha/beta hydrolase [Clostridiales bacterium]|nr:alpha/beta hydrolase [Clostridiales bacterium]